VSFAQQFDAQFGKSYRSIGDPLPPFTIFDKDSISHTDSEFIKGATTFIFLFNPGCDHCITMGKTIAENDGLFSLCNVYFVAASDMLPYLSPYFEKTKILQTKNIKVGVDGTDIVRNIYNYVSLPQLNIYSAKEQKLIKVFSGDTPIDSIKAYIGR